MDPYFKKDIKFNYNHGELTFRVSQSLFSSQDIDIGTRHLLKIIADLKLEKCKKILDLGCGYGPIGIGLKTTNPSSEVQMVDRDALALSYTNQNLEINHLTGVKVYASLGYDSVTESDFDLIVSNIPAKVGDKVLTHILKDSRFHLMPGGKMAIVVIDAIGDFVTKELNDPKIKILFAKRWPGYLVFIYEFLPTSSGPGAGISGSFKSGIYDRNRRQVSRDGINFSIKTTYNLSEFDTVSYETDLLLDSLRILKYKKLNSVLVFNPGQGYIPVMIFKSTDAKKISLVDRDMQALQLSKENLLSNGCRANTITISHQVDISIPSEGPFDSIVGILDEDDSSTVHALYLRETVDQLSAEGVIIIAAGSTAITRLESLLHKENFLRIVDRKRSKGKSVIVVKRKVQ